MCKLIRLPCFVKYFTLLFFSFFFKYFTAFPEEQRLQKSKKLLLFAVDLPPTGATRELAIGSFTSPGETLII